jgi:hypothetical protein
MLITGQCLCGQLAFETSAEPRNPHYCGCRICQRASGGQLVGWVDFPADEIRVSGPVVWYHSSAATRRGHCPNCGSTVLAEDGDGMLSISMASLDRPDSIRAATIAFAESLPASVNVSLPRHEI